MGRHSLNEELIKRDDEMLDLVSRGYLPDCEDRVDSELTRLLFAWRLSLSKYPRVLIDSDTAHTVVASARRASWCWAGITWSIWCLLFVLVFVVTGTIALGG